MENNSSYRLLKIKDILFNETDEETELSIAELIEKLQQGQDNRTYDNRTIKRDLKTLNYAGFEVVKRQGKFGRILYSHQSRQFELYQLRLLIDAILSARFITTKEKKKLINKVKQLTSKQIAKTLPGPIVFSQSANMDYDRVKLNIDHVHQAISKRKVITYQYGRFNVDKRFEFSRNGDFYYVEPYALIWQNDYYYLIGLFQKTNEMRHYRLDRIRNISITEETFKKAQFQLQEYVDQSFHMFAGEEARISIRFNNELVNVVLDRFGHDAHIVRKGEEHFVLSTKAKLSDGLVNWILTWGNQAKVLSPSHLVSTMKEKISSMNSVYQ